MVQITFLRDWDRFKAGNTRIIESTLAARLMMSGIAVQSTRVLKKEAAEPAPTPEPEPKVIEPKPSKIKKAIKKVFTKKQSDKRSKPSQKKGK